MKKILLSKAMVIIILLTCTFPVQAQVVVKIKPNPPTVKAVKPASRGPNFV